MRRHILTLTLLIVATIVIGFAVSRSKPEPSYRGRSLGSWFDYPQETAAERQLRDAALKAVGTNAIPTYFDWLHAKDSYPKRLLWPLFRLAHIDVHSGLRHIAIWQ